MPLYLEGHFLLLPLFEVVISGWLILLDLFTFFFWGLCLELKLNFKKTITY